MTDQKRLPSDQSNIQVAALDRVHLVVNGDTICGKVADVDVRDLYPPTSALLAWNDGPIPRCGMCAHVIASRVGPDRRRAAA